MNKSKTTLVGPPDYAAADKLDSQILGFSVLLVFVVFAGIFLWVNYGEDKPTKGKR